MSLKLTFWQNFTHLSSFVNSQMMIFLIVIVDKTRQLMFYFLAISIITVLYIYILIADMLICHWLHCNHDSWSWPSWIFLCRHKYAISPSTSFSLQSVSMTSCMKWSSAYFRPLSQVSHFKTNQLDILKKSSGNIVFNQLMEITDVASDGKINGCKLEMRSLL